MQESAQKISPIKQRILQFADTLGISKRKFYEKIGVSRGTLEAKTGITEDILTKFITIFPDVNPDWLVTGSGEIYRQNIPNTKSLQPSTLDTLLIRIEQLARENGQLQAEILELKKENARLASATAASALTS